MGLQDYLPSFSSISTLQVHHKSTGLNASTSCYPNTFSGLRPEEKYTMSIVQLQLINNKDIPESTKGTCLPLNASISLKLVLNKWFNSVLFPVKIVGNNVKALHIGVNYISTSNNTYRLTQANKTVTRKMNGKQKKKSIRSKRKGTSNIIWQNEVY